MKTAYNLDDVKLICWFSGTHKEVRQETVCNALLDEVRANIVSLPGNEILDIV